MPAINVTTCSSVNEFIAWLRRSNERWWPDNGNWSPWIFRGVGDADAWKLLPSAWRDTNNDLHELREIIHNLNLPIGQACPTSSNEAEKYRLYCEWVAAETEALYRYASAANELGFDIDAASYQSNRSPIRVGTIAGVDSSLKLIASSTQIVAQHHRIPTRLLDWTTNPLAAAHFAASYRNKEAHRICVWALNTELLSHQGAAENIFGSYEIRLFRPVRSFDSYVHAQSGCLTELCGCSALKKHFTKEGRWPTLEEVVEKVSVDTSILERFDLPAIHAEDLLVMLDREGVNRASLMPTLDNVADTVKARWKRENR